MSDNIRVGDQSCLPDILTVDLAETINSFLNKLWGFVLDSVPFLIFLHIFNTEVRA
mgnify:CR=1 FL=1